MRLDPFAEIALDEAGSVHTFCFNHAGVERVDPDLARTQLLGEHSGDGVDGAFGRRVNRGIGWRDAADAGADVDDAAAFRPDQFHRFLRCQQQSQHVQIEMVVEQLFGHAL